jgi:hypothetical protein
MRRMWTCIALSFFCATTAVETLGASALRSGEGQNPEEEHSALLRGLTSIPEWAAKLEVELRKEGQQIDRNKAKAQILPTVITVQSELSALESSNNNIVGDLGSDDQHVDRQKLHSDLSRTMDELNDITSSFGNLRANVQVVSIPDVTDIERMGEGLVQGKKRELGSVLTEFGYASTSHELSKNDYESIKAHSEHLIQILHQAQDAFASLHRSLEN